MSASRSEPRSGTTAAGVMSNRERCVRKSALSAFALAIFSRRRAFRRRLVNRSPRPASLRRRQNRRPNRGERRLDALRSFQLHARLRRLSLMLKRRSESEAATRPQSRRGCARHATSSTDCTPTSPTATAAFASMSTPTVGSATSSSTFAARRLGTAELRASYARLLRLYARE